MQACNPGIYIIPKPNQTRNNISTTKNTSALFSIQQPAMVCYLHVALPIVVVLITQTTTHTFAIQADALTELQASKCTPFEWGCPQGWQPAISYSIEAMDRLQETIHLNQPETDKNDPYKDADSYSMLPSGDKYGNNAPVCAIRFFDPNRKSYETQTYESLEAFVKESRKHPEFDQHLTHRGACGKCSSLQDLSVYLRYPDLTDPISSCSRNLLYSPNQLMKCFMKAVPFSEPCAMIWVFNAQYTKTACLGTCLFKIILQEYNNPDKDDSCVLNDCLKCDEVNSGPVFKAIAGRTRRASGLMSAIFRPYDTIFPITHCYHLPTSDTDSTARTAFDLPFMPKPGMSLSTLSCNDTEIAPGVCDIGKDRVLHKRMSRSVCIFIMVLLFLAVILSCCGPRGLCWRCCPGKNICARGESNRNDDFDSVPAADVSINDPIKRKKMKRSQLFFGGIFRDMWRKRRRSSASMVSVGSMSTSGGDWDANQEARYVELFGNELETVGSSADVVTTDKNNNSTSSSDNNYELTFSSPRESQGEMNSTTSQLHERRGSREMVLGTGSKLGSFTLRRRGNRASVMDNSSETNFAENGENGENGDLVDAEVNEDEDANETEGCLIHVQREASSVDSVHIDEM